MSEELKPCPFCGGQLDPTYETFKCCQGCGSEFGCSDETWNTRHTAEIEAQAVEKFAKLACRRMGNMTWIVELARAENESRKYASKPPKVTL